MISNGDSFRLNPNFVRSVNFVINNTYQIAVPTNGGVASARLNYSSVTQSRATNSHFPLEWALAVGNGIVTVRCLLEDLHSSSESGSGI
jgi:hypothetical protein